MYFLTKESLTALYLKKNYCFFLENVRKHCVASGFLVLKFLIPLTSNYSILPSQFMTK